MNTKRFEPKQWVRMVNLRESRFWRSDETLVKRIRRAAEYLHERFQRSHPEWISGDVRVRLHGTTGSFIRNQIPVVVEWLVFDDVPDQYRKALQGIADAWGPTSPRRFHYYELAAPEPLPLRAV